MHLVSLTFYVKSVTLWWSRADVLQFYPIWFSLSASEQNVAELHLQLRLCFFDFCHILFRRFGPLCVIRNYNSKSVLELLSVSFGKDENSFKDCLDEAICSSTTFILERLKAYSCLQ